MGSTEWEVPTDLNAYTDRGLKPWEQFNRKNLPNFLELGAESLLFTIKVAKRWKRVRTIQVWNPAVAPHSAAVSSSDLYHQREDEAWSRRYFLFAFTSEHDQPKRSHYPECRADPHGEHHLRLATSEEARWLLLVIQTVQQLWAEQSETHTRPCGSIYNHSSLLPVSSFHSCALYRVQTWSFWIVVHSCRSKSQLLLKITIKFPSTPAG